MRFYFQYSFLFVVYFIGWFIAHPRQNCPQIQDFNVTKCRTVHANLNQRPARMLIDESKMAVDSSLNYLNRRMQHTNLKLKTSIYSKIDNKTNLYLQNRSTKTSHNRPIQIAHCTLSRSINSDRTLWLHQPTTHTQTRKNCLRNQFLEWLETSSY